MTTMYLGWLHGAYDAKTEVASLPTTWAVPVFPSTHTLPRGNPLNAGAPVPCVTTSASACLMYARTDLDTGRWPTTGGVIFRTSLPSGLIRASPIRGLYKVPPRSGWHRASCLSRHVDSRRLAESPRQLHLLHLLHRRARAGDHIRLPVVPQPDVVAELVEDRVAGGDERRVQAHRAGINWIVVIERPAADAHGARTAVRPSQAVACLHRGRGGGYLPG